MVSTVGAIADSIPRLFTMSDRVLEHFQHGEESTYVQHMKIGLDLLESSKDALLMFSGYVRVETAGEVQFVAAGTDCGW